MKTHNKETKAKWIVAEYIVAPSQWQVFFVTIVAQQFLDRNWLISIYYMAIRSIGDIMVFTRPLPLHPYIIRLNATFHAATIYWINHIKNGYCLITDVVAILDFARILYQLIGTKQLQTKTKLLWGADIKLYISFHMATLNLTLADISRFFIGQNVPKMIYVHILCNLMSMYCATWCPCIVQLDIHVLCNIMSCIVQPYIVQHISQSSTAWTLKSHNHSRRIHGNQSASIPVTRLSSIKYTRHGHKSPTMNVHWSPTMHGN